MLFDARIPVAAAYEYLRIRFSTICKDLSSIISIRKLNNNLVSEIEQKEKAERRLRDALSLVQQLAVEDELTGLHNRRGFFSLAYQQIKYLRRQQKTFYLIYADLDVLREINDHYGHSDGDLAIQSAADVFRSALRESDIVARLGGDEFVALVNKAHPPEYSMIHERISGECDRKNRMLQRPWKLSISIGHFCSQPGCSMELHEMLALADEKLYREKMLVKKPDRKKN